MKPILMTIKVIKIIRQKHFAKVAACTLLFGLSISPLEASRKVDAQLKDVSFVAKKIRTLQPRMTRVRSMDLARSILRAATRYQIDPLLLVAIGQQESSFRENLPEGRAGEIGMWQIRKAWLSNKAFRREFPRASIKTLQNGEFNVLYAAWILRDLFNTRSGRDGVPAWTYFNARSLNHRITYYARVNSKYAVIAPRAPERARIVASAKPAAPKTLEKKPAATVQLASIVPEGGWIVRAVKSLSKKNRALGDKTIQQLGGKEYLSETAKIVPAVYRAPRGNPKIIMD